MLPLARGTNKQLRSSYIRSFRLEKKREGKSEREREKGREGRRGWGLAGEAEAG